jgi:hypothetical protein
MGISARALASRGAAMSQRQVARQQLQAFLLRHGRIYSGIKTWGPVYYRWLGGQKFELPAYQAVMQDYANAVLDADGRIKERDKQIASSALGSVVPGANVMANKEHPNSRRLSRCLHRNRRGTWRLP